MMIKRTIPHLERAMTVLMTGALIGYTLVTLTEVFFRYVVGAPLLWTNETARVLFLWSVYLGAAVAFHHDDHFRLFEIGQAPPKIRKILGVITQCANLVFLILVGAAMLSHMVSGRLRIMPLLGVSMGYGYASVVVLAILGVIFSIVRSNGTAAIQTGQTEQSEPTSLTSSRREDSS